MLPRVSLEVSGTTMLALLKYLEHRCFFSDKTMNEAVDHAILEWIRVQHAAEVITPVVEGYRWKNLFLPSGTMLEVRTRQGVHRADVRGNEIIFHGQAVSPNQFVAACAGADRNAWREIALRIPGERYWKWASALRDEAARLAELEKQATASAIAAGIPVPVVKPPPKKWLTEARERRLCDRRNGRDNDDIDNE